MTTADAAGFLAAILAHPGDDLPRLALADWLDEHDQPDRGEFIRVQCEIERTRARSSAGCSMLPDTTCSGSNGAFRQIGRPDLESWCSACLSKVALLGREQQLWSLHYDVWFPKPVDPSVVCLRHDPNVVVPSFVVRRGLLDELRVPDLAALLGTPYGRCEATGWGAVGPNGQPRCPTCRNNLQNAVPHGSPHLRRCASCKTVWGPEPCPHCTLGRVGGCRAVLRNEPVTTVRVTDRAPINRYREGVGDEWAWCCGSTWADPIAASFFIPEEFGAFFPAATPVWGGHFYLFDTEADAHAGLSAAVIAWARSPG